jgi:5-methylcytosine-specific restriction endonuclease McrA
VALMPLGRLCPACGEMTFGESCECGNDPGVRNRRIYDDPRWKNRTRPIVLERESETCVECGYSPARVVDHVVPIETLVALGLDPFDPNECQLLCDRCSGKKDGPRAHVRFV